MASDVSCRSWWTLISDLQLLMTFRSQTWLPIGCIGTRERTERALTISLERGRATRERTAERGKGPNLQGHDALASIPSGPVHRTTSPTTPAPTSR
eukprot:3565809-Pyramimonas_sp.AAC.1